MQRWYVNGDVACYRGLHLPLALLAIIVLVASFMAIPFTAFIAIKKVKKCFPLYIILYTVPEFKILHASDVV